MSRLRPRNCPQVPNRLRDWLKVLKHDRSLDDQVCRVVVLAVVGQAAQRPSPASIIGILRACGRVERRT